MCHAYNEKKGKRKTFEEIELSNPERTRKIKNSTNTSEY